MKITRLKIPMYDYTLLFAEVEGREDAETALLKRTMNEVKIEESDQEEIISSIKRDERNGGVTYRNMDVKKLLVIISRTTSETIRRNVVAHELRHVVDRILEHTQVNDLEAAAYLTGYIAEKIY